MATARRQPLGDKAALSPGRRYRETPEVVAATRRLLRVVGKRIATEDADDLRLLIDLEHEVQRAWAVAIAGIRSSGATDREIGRVLGTTKQAVAQRWPREKA